LGDTTLSSAGKDLVDICDPPAIGDFCFGPTVHLSRPGRLLGIAQVTYTGNGAGRGHCNPGVSTGDTTLSIAGAGTGPLTTSSPTGYVLALTSVLAAGDHGITLLCTEDTLDASFSSYTVVTTLAAN